MGGIQRPASHDQHGEEQMKRKLQGYLRAALLCAAFCVASVAFAQTQIVNGNFDQYGAGWTWKEQNAHQWGTLFSTCEQSMQAFSPASGWPHFLDFGSQTRVAKAIPQSPSATGNWELCREFSSQAVDVPIAASFQFTYRLGDVLSAYAEGVVSDVDLDVWAEPEVGPRIFLKRLTGRSVKSTGTGGCPAIGCPTFKSITVDASPVWGQRVKLVFSAKTRAHRSSLNTMLIPSSAYVDDVALVNAPVLANPHPKAGSWYNPSRSGHGLNISRAPNGHLVLSWYTYLPDGTPIWYMSDVQPLSGGVWNGTLKKATRDLNSRGLSVTLETIGDVRLDFINNTQAVFYWDLHSVNGNNAGFDGYEYMTHLWGGDSFTGQWYEPAYSGWGFNLDYQQMVNITGATVFYYDGSEPTWAQGTTSGAPTNNRVINLKRYTGIGLCPQCTGPTQLTHSPAGSITLNLNSSTGAGTGWSSIPDWLRGSSASPVGISRLTRP